MIVKIAATVIEENSICVNVTNATIISASWIIARTAARARSHLKRIVAYTQIKAKVARTRTIEPKTNPFEKLEDIIKNIVYLSSFRKPPERYYVPENNTRKYVGKNGEYTSEILYDSDVKNDINHWLKEITGYELSSENKNLKVNSINLNDKETNLNGINLIDLGSGIAQVLPIITQTFKSENDLILIEEPEIHLHPKAQSKLGVLFATAVKKRNNTFIIETHSENLLLKLQRLVRNKELAKDDVSIIYVNKDEKGSHCISLNLDDEGDIENINEVPNGFFEEGFNDLFDIGQE